MSVQVITPDTVTKTETFFQKHERLLIVLLCVVLVAFGWNKIVNYLDAKDSRQAAVSQQILNEQKAQNAVLAAQAQKDRADYAVQLSALSQANQTLLSSIRSLEAQLQKQRQVDSTLPLPDLASRWAGLANLAPTEIQAVPNGVSVTESGARKTTQALESVPVLTQELVDEKQIISNKDNQIADLTKVLDSNSALVVGLNSQITKADTACKDEVKAVKAQARKSKIRWFLIGYVAGLITKPIVAATGL